MTRVRVLLNQDVRNSFCYGYRSGDPLKFAVSYQADVSSAKNADGLPLSILENAFERFNIGEPEKDSIVFEYRVLGRNRSLSVGDLVQVDDEVYACSSFGWDKVSDTDAVLKGLDRYHWEVVDAIDKPRARADRDS